MAKNAFLILLTGGSAFCGLLLLPELFSYETNWQSAAPWLVLGCIVAATIATLLFWKQRLRASSLLATPHAVLGACLLWLAIRAIRAGNYDGVLGLANLAVWVLCPFGAAVCIFTSDDCHASMILWDRVNELRQRSAELKLQGAFAAMLPLREEAARLLEEHHASAKEVANGWNYVAYVNLKIGAFGAAERAARRSLSHYVENAAEKDALLATYLFMLAMTLEGQNRFVDALPHAEEAVRLFAQLHGEDAFVEGRRADLEKIREQLWKG